MPKPTAAEQAANAAKGAQPALIVPGAVRNALNQETAEALRDLLRHAGQDVERSGTELRDVIHSVTRDLGKVTRELKERGPLEANVNGLCSFIERGDVRGFSPRMSPRSCGLLLALDRCVNDR